MRARRTTRQAHSFELELDTTSGFGAYTRGGIVTQHKEPRVLAFKRLAEALEAPGEFLLSDFSKTERSPLLHVAFQALDTYQVRAARVWLGGSPRIAARGAVAVSQASPPAAPLAHAPLTPAARPATAHTRHRRRSTARCRAPVWRPTPTRCWRWCTAWRAKPSPRLRWTRASCASLRQVRVCVCVCVFGAAGSAPAVDMSRVFRGARGAERGKGRVHGSAAHTLRRPPPPAPPTHATTQPHAQAPLAS
jgi:hypothetical protein